VSKLQAREKPATFNLQGFWTTGISITAANDGADRQLHAPVTRQPLWIRPEHFPESARARDAENGFTSNAEEIIVTGDQNVRASGFGRGENPAIRVVSDLKGAGLLRLGYNGNTLEDSFSGTDPVRRNLKLP